MSFSIRSACTTADEGDADGASVALTLYDSINVAERGGKVEHWGEGGQGGGWTGDIGAQEGDREGEGRLGVHGGMKGESGGAGGGVRGNASQSCEDGRAHGVQV